MEFRGHRFRASVVVLATVVLGGSAILLAPRADASWCGAANELGNASVDVGATAVAVAQTNVGNPDAHAVYACSDPAGQVFLSLTNDDPGRTGHQVSASACPLLLGCSGVAKTGAEVGTPGTTLDLPADGNNHVAAWVHTGSGLCLWVGLQRCDLGGASYGGSQPLIEPIPTTGDVDVVVNEAGGLPARCFYYTQWAGLEFGLFFCTWDAKNVPFYVVWTLIT